MAAGRFGVDKTCLVVWWLLGCAPSEGVSHTLYSFATPPMGTTLCAWATHEHFGAHGASEETVQHFQQR